MTIPNLAPKMNAYALSLDEFKDVMSEDTYQWVEIRRDTFNYDGDEMFYLRLHIIQKDDVDFSEPSAYVNLEFEDYGTYWRVWNIYPTEEARENTNWERG